MALCYRVVCACLEGQTTERKQEAQTTRQLAQARPAARALARSRTAAAQQGALVKRHDLLAPSLGLWRPGCARHAAQLRRLRLRGGIAGG